MKGFSINKRQWVFFEKHNVIWGFPFILMTFVTTVRYFFGIGFKPNDIATYVNVGAQVSYFAFALYLLISKKDYFLENKRGILLLVCVFAYYLISYLIPILEGNKQDFLIRRFWIFILTGPPTLVLGSFAAEKKYQIKMRKAMHLINPFVLILCIHYLLLNITRAAPKEFLNTGLGYTDYMTFSYMIMPLFIYQYSLLFLKQYTKNKINKVGVFLSLAVYFFSLLMASTRGAILGVMLAVVSSLFFFRENIRARKMTVAVFVALFMIYIFISRIYTPIGFERINRVQLAETERTVTIGEIEKQEVSEEENLTSQETSFFITGTEKSKVISNTNTTKEAISKTDTTSTKEATSKTVATIKITETDKNTKEASLEYAMNNPKKLQASDFHNRSFLYALAINEFLENPLTGLGPHGYSIKYQSVYPHNVLLELLVENGLIFGGAYIVFLILILFKLIVFALNSNSFPFVPVLLLSYLVQAMVSGTVWTNTVILYMVAYVLYSNTVKKRTLSEKK